MQHGIFLLVCSVGLMTTAPSRGSVELPRFIRHIALSQSQSLLLSKSYTTSFTACEEFAVVAGKIKQSG